MVGRVSGGEHMDLMGGGRGNLDHARVLRRYGTDFAGLCGVEADYKAGRHDAFQQFHLLSLRVDGVIGNEARRLRSIPRLDT